jgi:hypothetical protein
VIFSTTDGNGVALPRLDNIALSPKLLHSSSPPKPPMPPQALPHNAVPQDHVAGAALFALCSRVPQLLHVPCSSIVAAVSSCRFYHSLYLCSVEYLLSLICPCKQVQDTEGFTSPDYFAKEIPWSIFNAYTHVHLLYVVDITLTPHRSLKKAHDYSSYPEAFTSHLVMSTCHVLKEALASCIEYLDVVFSTTNLFRSFISVVYYNSSISRFCLLFSLQHINSQK